MLDFIFSIGILLFGFVFIHINKKGQTKQDLIKLKKLWIYHIFFILLFYFYSQSNSADAVGYWRVAKNSTEGGFLFYLFKGSGTSFMYVINYFPAKILGLSFFSGMMFYGLLGFIGFWFFYRVITDLIPYNSKFYKFNLFPLLFFLPNMHFWSAAVGKDTLMFFCIGLFSFSLLKIYKRFPLIIASSFLMYMTRPHVIIILLFSFSLAFLFSRKINNFKKIIFTSLLVGIVIIILPKVLEYVNLEEESTVSDVISRSKSQATHLSGENIGSSIDISSYPYPLKVLSFLFRPLFFDYNGLFSLFSSFENLLLLLLTIRVIRRDFLKSFRNSPVIIKGLTYFLIFGALIFSLSLSNLGIILRMKNMFTPGFLIFILWNLSYQNDNKLHNKIK